MEYMTVGGFFGVMFGVLIVLLLICLVCYILQAIGLYKIAKHYEYDKAFCAWIPIANLWLLGDLISLIGAGSLSLPNWGLLLPIIMIGGSILGSLIPVVGPLVSLAVYVFYIVLVGTWLKNYNTSVTAYVFAIFPFIGFLVTGSALSNTPKSGGSLDGLEQLQ
jgi:hypothetical protein